MKLAYVEKYCFYKFFEGFGPEMVFDQKGARQLVFETMAYSLNIHMIIELR